MRSWTRRMATTVVAAGTVLMLSASAAFAHYCAKTDFNDKAREKVAASSAWTDGETFLAELAAGVDEEGFPPCFDAEAALAVFEDFFAVHPDWLFKGPGLIGGGALKSGNLPGHFSHELGQVFDEAVATGFAACGPIVE